MKEKRSLRQRIRSFRHAFNGIRVLFRDETNARIQLLATFAICTLGGFLRIEAWEWAIILLASALVLSLEALNGAVEKLADHLAPERHRTIGLVKDLSAGSVLIAAIFAVILAVLIFLPHLLGAN